MSLQPVDPILDTILTLAERDPRAAQELVRLSLYESLTEQVAKARPRLDRDGAKWMASQVLKARETFEQAGVAKAMEGDPETAEILEGLEAIEVYIQKDLLGTALSFFNRTHPRDEQGRFIRSDVRVSGSADEMVRGGQHHNRIATYIDQWKKNHLVDDNTSVAIHWKDAKVDPATGKVVIDANAQEDMTHHKVGQLTANDGAGLSQLVALQGSTTQNGTTQVPVGVSFDRGGIPDMGRNARAALDATAMFTGASGTQTAAQLLRGMPDNVQGMGDSPGREWNRPTSPGDRQSYRRLQMTGQALQHASVPGSMADTVGGMARLIGDLGPEAEKVFGPGVRRTAYRYRGTERRPDPGIVRAVEEAHRYAGAISGSDEISAEDKLMMEQQLKLAPKGEIEPELGVAQHYQGRTYSSWSQDRLELAMQGDTAAVTLLETVPNQKLAAVSIEAGELPPSVGVLIDADGDIVSHAQGYNGDHYLPFDLKNLADLGGGQYVRTRAAGGPTTEDIYTGLLTGARQVQVVSNSGVFTVEFDPDLRGSRRYSDKAVRMIQRYGSLLEAIEGGKLFENDVDTARRNELRTKAYESVGWDPQQGAKRYDDLLKKERLQATVNDEDEDAVYAAAIAEVDEAETSQRAAGRGFTNQQRVRHIEDAVKRIKGEENAKRVRQMVLDGKGYATALMSLKQEFPFYIRDVRFETLDDFTARRGTRTNPAQSFAPHATDRGYTQRGQTNAKVTLKEGSPTAGRKVLTERMTGGGQTQGGAQVTGGGAVASQPQRTNARQAGAPSTATQAAPVRDGNVVAPIAPETKLFSEIMGPGSPVEDNLRGALSRTMGIMTMYGQAERLNGFLELDADDTENNITSANADQFAHFIATKRFEDSPSGLAKWLYNEATDAQREKFFKGMHAAREAAENWSDGRGEGGGKRFMEARAGSVDQFDEQLDTLEQLIKLKSPFAQPADDMVLADPDADHLKPQPFPAVVQLGDKVANYEKYLEMAKTDDPALFEAIERADAKTEDVIDNIRTLRHKIKVESGKEAPSQDVLDAATKELETLQRAWSFSTAYDIAEVVDEGKEEAPEEGPEETSKAHQRRVLVFHSPSEPFSKRVLRGLDLSQ